MALFEGNVPRSAGLAAAIALGTWFMVGAIPNNLYALNITQTSVAMLALSALAILVVAHYRAQATVITRAQEEMMLIGTFGFFFLALLVALRAFQVRGGQLDYGEYVEPAARQVASAAKSVARQGNKVLAGEKNVRDWEPPINRWQNAYTTEEWVYY